MAENLPQSEPFTGRAGHLSPAQCETLKALKEHLVATEPLYKAELYDDYYLLRFLRARKFDLQKTLLMFTNYLKWRVEFKVDELVATFQFPEQDQVHEIYPKYYHKVGKEGHPVYIEVLGKLNVKKLQQVTTIERILQNHVVEYEKLLRVRFPACTKAAAPVDGGGGKAVVIDSSITILDLHGVGLMQFAQVLGFIKQISSIAQNYYPEGLLKMFIINSPFLFSTCWSAIKPLLDEHTLSKITLVGSKYEDLLLDVIDPGNLPKQFGGQCECPLGCDKSDAGPWNGEK